VDMRQVAMHRQGLAHLSHGADIRPLQAFLDSIGERGLGGLKKASLEVVVARGAPSQHL
jgi:hypothetical protein